MKSTFVLIIAVCTVAAAMVPRDRRAVNTEEEMEVMESKLDTIATPTNTGTIHRICSSGTPCGWSLYTASSKYITMNITNTYCVCSSDMVCQQSEDDVSVSSYILRCSPPMNTEENTDSESTDDS